jgi:hypothetical protein
MPLFIYYNIKILSLLLQYNDIIMAIYFRFNVFTNKSNKAVAVLITPFAYITANSSKILHMNI